MKNISSWPKWTWSGGPSPGLCHAMRTEIAPPVASVVRSTFMSRPKGVIGNPCSGLITVACSGVVLASMMVSPVCGSVHGAQMPLARADVVSWLRPGAQSRCQSRAGRAAADNNDVDGVCGHLQDPFCCGLHMSDTRLANRAGASSCHSADSVQHVGISRAIFGPRPCAIPQSCAAGGQTRPEAGGEGAVGRAERYA